MCESKFLFHVFFFVLRLVRFNHLVFVESTHDELDKVIVSIQISVWTVDNNNACEHWTPDDHLTYYINSFTLFNWMNSITSIPLPLSLSQVKVIISHNPTKEILAKQNKKKIESWRLRHDVLLQFFFKPFAGQSSKFNCFCGVGCGLSKLQTKWSLTFMNWWTIEQWTRIDCYVNAPHTNL